MRIADKKVPHIACWNGRFHLRAFNCNFLNFTTAHCFRTGLDTDNDAKPKGAILILHWQITNKINLIWLRKGFTHELKMSPDPQAVFWHLYVNSFFFLEIQVHSAQMLSKSGGPAHYALVTKPMHSGGPEVDAMRRGTDAIER